MFLVRLADDAEPGYIEWDSVLVGAVEVKRYLGPEKKYDPENEGEPAYKLRDDVGRKAYVRADKVEHIEPV